MQIGQRPDESTFLALVVTQWMNQLEPVELRIVLYLYHHDCVDASPCSAGEASSIADGIQTSRSYAIRMLRGLIRLGLVQIVEGTIYTLNTSWRPYNAERTP
jgi:DNA-binding MarR family transcriptional regulator